MSTTTMSQPDAAKRPLPEGWRWVKLSDLIVCLESGSRPRGGARDINSGVPSISAEHMRNNGTFDFALLRYVPRGYYETMRRGHIHRGDILIVKDGATTGKTCFVDERFPFNEAVVNEHVFICRAETSKIIPEFLFFWLWGPEGQSEIRANYQGAAIGGINQSFIETVFVPVPDLPKQKRIVSILREQMAAVERARRAAEEQLQAAKALPAAYLRQVFPRHGEPLPEGWRWVKLGDLGKFESGGTPSKDNPKYWGGQIPFITGADVTDIHVSAQNSRAFLTEEGLKSGKTAICPEGSILLVTRTRVGRVGIATEIVGASQDLSPFICGESIIPEYLCRYLLSIGGFLQANCRGATIQGLTREFVYNLPIPVPPLAEQRRIAAILREQMTAVERLRRTLEEQLETINKLPAAILREAFEGRL